ncbi:hypothetical protein M422DRAFT_92825, partial [Sphaerobolus stellatus SS14]
KWTNETLLHHGCLGSAPLKPQSAFTLHTLAQYHETHRSCPRLSIEAEIRALCNLNKIPYQKPMADQFCIAYDTYLEILGRVQAQVDVALKHDSPNWRALNACPACDYRLNGELSLTYSKLICIDGNNSLRRVNLKLTRDVVAYIDTRTARMDYWITPQEVDVFKNEVRARRAKLGADEMEDDATQVYEPGDVADGASFTSICVECWRNAGPDERKKMWEMFVETGVFVA